MESWPKKCLSHAGELVQWLTLGWLVKCYKDIAEFSWRNEMGWIFYNKYNCYQPSLSFWTVKKTNKLYLTCVWNHFFNSVTLYTYWNIVLKYEVWNIFSSLTLKVSETRNNCINIYVQCFHITLYKFWTCDKSMEVIYLSR